MKCPYEVLGVSKTATAKEIQSAYRRIAKKYHPDVNPDNQEAVEKFKDAAQANSILSDLDKRKDYDLGLIDFNGDRISSHQNPWQGQDPFGGFSGNFWNFNRNIKNPNVVVNYQIDTSDLFSEYKAEIKYTKTALCIDCGGSGGTGNHTKCNDCNGCGRQIRHQQAGNMIIQQDFGTCPKCHGRGKIFDASCAGCNGIGLKTSNEQITIMLPAHCAYRSMVVQGHGHQEIQNTPPGDLIINVTPASKNYKFSGHTAVYELLIDPIQAMLGCKVNIPGLKTKEELVIDVPKMTKPNTRIVLKQKGLGDMNGTRHDVHIVIVYKMPTELSDAQENALSAYLSEIKTEKEK